MVKPMTSSIFFAVLVALPVTLAGCASDADEDDVLELDEGGKQDQLSPLLSLQSGEASSFEVSCNSDDCLLIGKVEVMSSSDAARTADPAFVELYLRNLSQHFSFPLDGKEDVFDDASAIDKVRVELISELDDTLWVSGSELEEGLYYVTVVNPAYGGDAFEYRLTFNGGSF